MLPVELLRAYTRKGQIKPIYSNLTKENLDLASALLNLFKNHLGKQKGELLDKISAYEIDGANYKLVRGLSLILERLCTFQVDALIDPSTARRALFTEANSRGLVITAEIRNQVFQVVANKLGVIVEDLEKSFQADLESEMVLKEFTPINPSELLKRYNFALTQTILFNSTFMEVKVSEDWKAVLRGIKFRGLMYFAEMRGDNFMITIDGPSALFKLTQRYGVSMAKVLPTIIKARIWEINASILRTNQFCKRIYHLNLTSVDVGDKINPSNLIQERSESKFDSFVEEKFFRDFQSLNTDWKIIREPPPLIVGRQVFVPDFRFEREGIKIYMEIVGFWTPKYLEAKVNKLQQLRGVDIIIAADEHLDCDKLKYVKGRLIFYKGKVPLKPILNFLKSRWEIHVQLEIENVKLTPFNLNGEVIQLHQLANEYGVSDEALRRKLEGFEVKGYTLVGDFLISNDKLVEIDLKIASLMKSSLSRIIRLIKDEGIENPFDILSTLGYEIIWRGLDVNNSSICKKQR